VLLTNDTAMAVVALILYALGGAVGIGWRSWRQWRQTGSAGFRWMSGHLGSVERLAGAGLIVALSLAVLAPVLQLAGVFSPLPFLNTGWIHAVGIVLAVVGLTATVYSQLAMGDSWRIGVDGSETTTLVHTGVFGLVRNPIYVGMLTFFLGTMLITPRIVAIVGYLLLLASIELQVRLIEEPYLMRVHGDAYREYARHVGRFIPGVGPLREPKLAAGRRL
jgi:protein-S-isoprenylcysteine O-methyltransferase Ste14